MLCLSLVRPRAARRSSTACLFSGCASITLLVVGLFHAVAPCIARAQLIRSVTPPGISTTQATQLTVVTEGISPAALARAELETGRVPLSLLIGEQTVKATVLSVAENQWRLHVDLAALESPSAAVSPGIYPLRMITPEGLVTSAAQVAVDALPQAPFGPQIDSLPVALHGELAGDAILKTRLLGRAGQRLVVELEGRRLGSQVRPVLRLYSPSLRPLAVARPTKRLAGDTRLVVTLPEDGMYQLELQDIAFKGPAPGGFRLLLGDLQFVDGVFPLAVSGPGRHSLEFWGSWSGTRSMPFGPSAARRWCVLDGFDRELQSLRPGALVGPAPRVYLSPLGSREYRETDLDGQAQTLPFAVNGRLTRPGEVDQYSVIAPPGTEIHAELFADRWGQAWDGVIEAVAADGQVIARGDDQAGTTDPGLVVKTPGGNEPLQLRVSSLTSSGGRDHVYRLLVNGKSKSAPKLRLDTDRIQLTAGGLTVQALQWDRDDQAERTDWTLGVPESLASAVHLVTPSVSASDEVPLLALRAAPEARGVFPARLVVSQQGVGDSQWLTVTPSYPSPLAGDVNGPVWLSITQPAPIQLTWHQAPKQLVAGASHRLKLGVVSHSPATHPVRLSLLTSQRPRTKRQDNQEVVDAERNLRLDAQPMVSAEQSESELLLHVPTDLPAGPWSLVIVGEVLAEDQQQVISRVFSELLRLPTITPARIIPTVSEPLSVSAGSRLVLAATLERDAAYRWPMRVSLTGLGDAIDPPTQLLPADESAIELTLEVPADAEPREIAGIRLIATFETADSELATVRVQSPELKLTVRPN